MIHLKIAEATPTEISPWSMGIEARNMATRQKYDTRNLAVRNKNSEMKPQNTPQEIISYGHRTMQHVCLFLGWSSIPRKQANRRGWYKHWKEAVMVGLPGSVVSPRWYPKSQDQRRHQLSLSRACIDPQQLWSYLANSRRFNGISFCICHLRLNQEAIECELQGSVCTIYEYIYIYMYR